MPHLPSDEERRTWARLDETMKRTIDQDLLNYTAQEMKRLMRHMTPEEQAEWLEKYETVKETRSFWQKWLGK